jgi:hypothetical protein
VRSALGWGVPVSARVCICILIPDAGAPDLDSGAGESRTGRWSTNRAHGLLTRFTLCEREGTGLTERVVGSVRGLPRQSTLTGYI